MRETFLTFQTKLTYIKIGTTQKTDPFSYNDHINLDNVHLILMYLPTGAYMLHTNPIYRRHPSNK